MISIVYLILSLFGAWLTWNVFRPSYAPANRATLSWIAGWLTAELALHHIALQAIVTAAFAAGGAFEALPGRIGLWVTLLSWMGLAFSQLQAREAKPAMEKALQGALGAEYAGRIDRDLGERAPDDLEPRSLVLPFPVRHPEVERIVDIRFRRVRGVNLRLDVYRPRSRPTNGPVLLNVHGGGWVVGSKKEQGLPLMIRLAREGWVCVSADYRLSPHATFPEHLVDVKHALAWVRENVAAYGGDPDFVVVSGQSAGGHLASLMALTANDPELEEGLENVDTAVRGCVSFYGVYDFLDREGHWRNDGLARLLEERVMKASIQEDPEAYRNASPLDRIHPDAPPFLVIHGDVDTLVPVEQARTFTEALRRTSRSPVVYAEIPGGHHAFEMFPSIRTACVVAGAARFLSYVYSEYRRGRQEKRSGSMATG